MPFYVGIDFHKHYSVFCVIDARNSVLERGRIDHKLPIRFEPLLKRYPGCRVVFETTMNWHWLYEILEAHVNHKVKGDQAVCFVFSFALVALARHVPARTLHIVCLSLGGLGLASVPFMPGKDFLFLSMAGVGIAWSSILSMPYALLANCIPAAKTGFYMGVFNFFIVLPQIAISLGLGEALRFFPAVDSAMVIMGGGFCFLLAAGLTLRVKPRAHAS